MVSDALRASAKMGAGHLPSVLLPQPELQPLLDAVVPPLDAVVPLLEEDAHLLSSSRRHRIPNTCTFSLQASVSAKVRSASAGVAMIKPVNSGPDSHLTIFIIIIIINRLYPERLRFYPRKSGASVETPCLRHSPLTSPCADNTSCAVPPPAGRLEHSPSSTFKGGFEDSNQTAVQPKHDLVLPALHPI